MEISESEAQRTGKYHRLTGARPAGFLHSGFRYAPPLIHSLRRALCSFFAQLFFSKLCLTSLTNVHFDASVLSLSELPFPNVLPFPSMGSLGAVVANADLPVVLWAVLPKNREAKRKHTFCIPGFCRKIPRKSHR